MMKGKKLIWEAGVGGRHSYLEVGMRRSGSPIFEKHRSTKRKKNVALPASRASPVGGTDSQRGQKEPGPFESELLSNLSFHLWGDNI